VSFVLNIEIGIDIEIGIEIGIEIRIGIGIDIGIGNYNDCAARREKTTPFRVSRAKLHESWDCEFDFDPDIDFDIEQEVRDQWLLKHDEFRGHVRRSKVLLRKSPLKVGMAS
jgi:hypothetical protein